jgi:hypothetical protein
MKIFSLVSPQTFYATLDSRCSVNVASARRYMFTSDIYQINGKSFIKQRSAWLAQSVERETLRFHLLKKRLIHLKVAGSTPASGFLFFLRFLMLFVDDWGRWWSSGARMVKVVDLGG